MGVIISNIIAGIALLLSGVAIYQTHKKDKKEENNKKKALVCAEPMQKSLQFCTVKITNAGIGKAKNIRIICNAIKTDGKEIGTYLIIEDGLLPYRILNRGESFNIIAKYSKHDTHILSIKIKWDDRYEKNREYEQILNFV